MGIKKTTTKPPPAHPKTKRSLTRHKVTSYQFPPSDDEHRELADENEKNTAEAFLSRAEDWARGVLTAAKLPTKLDAAVRGDADGNWRDDLPEGWGQQKRADVLKRGEAVTSLLGLVKDRLHSPEWLAERILRFASATRRQMQLRDAPGAVWASMHLMQAIHLAEFKLDLERPLDVGIRSIESGKHGKVRSRQTEHMEWKALLDEITGRFPEISKAEVHRIVAERRGVKAEAVKKALWRLEKRAQT